MVIFLERRHHLLSMTNSLSSMSEQMSRAQYYTSNAQWSKFLDFVQTLWDTVEIKIIRNLFLKGNLALTWNFHLAKQNVNINLSELSKSPAKSYNLHQVKGTIFWFWNFRSWLEENSIICRTNVCNRIINKKKDVEGLESTFEFLWSLR